VQASKLHLFEEQEKTDGEVGDKKILQVLPEAHAPQGSQVTGGSLFSGKKEENRGGE